MRNLVNTDHKVDTSHQLATTMISNTTNNTIISNTKTIIIHSTSHKTIMIIATIRTMTRITTNPTKTAEAMLRERAEAIAMLGSMMTTTTITKITITTMEANMTTATSSNTTSKRPQPTTRSIAHGSKVKTKRKGSTHMTSIAMLVEMIVMEILRGRIEQLKQEGAQPIITRDGRVRLSMVATLITWILGIKTQPQSSKRSIVRSTPVSTKVTMIMPRPRQHPTKQTQGPLEDWALEL